MTAKEMFAEAGYEQTQNGWLNLVYSTGEKGTYIIFDKPHQYIQFMKYDRYGGGWVPVQVRPVAMQAVYQQMIELGWRLE